MLRYMTDLV